MGSTGFPYRHNRHNRHVPRAPRLKGPPQVPLGTLKFLKNYSKQDMYIEFMILS